MKKEVIDIRLNDLIRELFKDKKISGRKYDECVQKIKEIRRIIKLK